jgi:hypothetical protein
MGRRVLPALARKGGTSQEIEEWKAVPNAFTSMVLAEGKLLYER